MREYLWNISGKSPKKKKDLKLQKKKEKEFERFCLCGICSLCNQQEYYRRMQKIFEEYGSYQKSMEECRRLSKKKRKILKWFI